MSFHSESDKNYHAWLGRYISTWSVTEIMLFTLIRSVHLAQRKKFNRKPINLERKISTLRTAFSTCELIAVEEEEACAILDFIHAESEFRHTLIHGVNANFMKAEKWLAQMWRPEREVEPNEQNVTFVDQDELEKRTHNVGVAGLAIVALNSRVLSLIEDAISLR